MPVTYTRAPSGLAATARALCSRWPPSRAIHSMLVSAAWAGRAGQAMADDSIGASPEHLRQPTEFGIVGEVTFKGTLGLVIFGAIAGLFFGLLYLALRSWLPGGWATRGLAFGLLLLPPVGIFIVASSKTDFDLTSLALIFSLFAGMILVYGLATAWSIEGLGRRFLPPPRPHAFGYVVLGAIASLGFVALGNAVSDVL